MPEAQIRNLIARYLANQIDRSAFSQAFAKLYFQVRNNRNASLTARRLCDGIVLPFAELSRGDRTEQSFREELARIVPPFVAVFHYEATQNPQEFTLSGSPERIGPKPELGTGLLDENYQLAYA